MPADLGELEDRRVLAVGEVGIAVAELLRQVELEACRELAAPLRGSPVEREALEHLLRRSQVALAVAAPLGLAAFERRPAADRDEHVLEERAARVVRVDVPRRDSLDAEVLREVPQRRVPARVSALERPLELDVEAPSAERRRELSRRVRVPDREPVARTAGEADEPLAQLRDPLERHRRRQRLPVLVTRPPRPRVRLGEEPAEVRVTAPALHEQRQVCASIQCHLRARDRPHAEELRRVRELERAVDPVVIGERERLVPELGRGRRELLRLGRAVEERERGVAVQLDVAHD